jgi:hypothetical protein
VFPVQFRHRPLMPFILIDKPKLLVHRTARFPGQEIVSTPSRPRRSVSNVPGSKCQLRARSVPHATTTPHPLYDLPPYLETKDLRAGYIPGTTGPQGSKIFRSVPDLSLEPTAVLQLLWSLWIEQCGVYFHPSKQQLLAPRFATPEMKTPLGRIGSALHQLENCSMTSLGNLRNSSALEKLN